MGIAPQLQRYAKRTHEECGLEYDLLVDEGNEVARSFNLSYEFSEELRDLYLNTFSIDVGRYNGGDDRWELPLTARYVIGSDGVIEWSAVAFDHTDRPEPEVTLGVVESL